MKKMKKMRKKNKNIIFRVVNIGKRSNMEVLIRFLGYLIMENINIIKPTKKIMQNTSTNIMDILQIIKRKNLRIKNKLKLKPDKTAKSL